MIRLRVPVIIVIIGEGASGGALGIGVGDRMLMMENSWYTVISPESCSYYPLAQLEFQGKSCRRTETHL
jgi:acetyl-CoA carboxylase carboxyl transferase subunit alpha